jgi:hypothetical protein
LAKISREQFIEICNTAIEKTRQEIAICNQVSGYKKFHKAIRDEDYLKKVRAILNKTETDGPVEKHAIIKQYSLGNCHELADYLGVEIGKILREKEVKVQIKIVSSLRVDHVYTEIKIYLRDEKYHSRWEVDAWDPRVIDISKRKDGSVKNIEHLKYGYHVKTKSSFNSTDLKVKGSYPFFKLKKPQVGPPERSPTPERKILSKHPNIYTDHTIEHSRKRKKLCDSSDLGYQQKASKWQRSMPIPFSS